MITRVIAKNFGSIASMDVTLGPLSVLVGQNGSGKTTFVKVLRFVRDALESGLEHTFNKHGGLGLIHQFTRRVKDFLEIEIILHLTGVDFTAEYGFTFVAFPIEGFRVTHEFCKIHSDIPNLNDSFEINQDEWIEQPKHVLTDSGNLNFNNTDSSGLVLPILSSASQAFKRVRQALVGGYYDFNIREMRSIRNPSSDSILNDSGSNITTVLKNLERKEREAFQDIISTLGSIVPDIKNIQIHENANFIFTFLEHSCIEKDSTVNTRNDDIYLNNIEYVDIPLDSESDGTIRVLGILVALLQPSPPNSYYAPLSIEEPELSLHPGALGVIADVIREAATRRQVIITTQSPDLISRFRAEEILVVEKKAGVTHIGPLDATQRHIIEEQLFSAGDLLRIEGLRREPIPQLSQQKNGVLVR